MSSQLPAAAEKFIARLESMLTVGPAVPTTAALELGIEVGLSATAAGELLLEACRDGRLRAVHLAPNRTGLLMPAAAVDRLQRTARPGEQTIFVAGPPRAR